MKTITKACFLLLIFSLILTNFFTLPRPARADADFYNIEQSAALPALPPMEKMVELAAGASHTCTLLEDSGVKCWGTNQWGQLGNGPGAYRYVGVAPAGLEAGVTAIATGSNHTCALLANGGVKCWGFNQYGQVGFMKGFNQMTPVDVYELGSGVKAITAGENHSCALTTGGGVKCWGANEVGVGQLGNGSEYDSVWPVDVWGLISGVKAIAAGGNNTCALLDNGTLKCWGGNFANQPVDVTGLSGVKAVSAGGRHICALLDTGGVKCWGWNSYGQLGNATNIDSTEPVDVTGLGSGVSAVKAGHNHTCALLSTGAVKCWGWNRSGQLGDGTNLNSSKPVSLPDLPLGFVSIAAGGRHTCALLQTGQAKCWGANGEGQLGIGPISFPEQPMQVGGLSQGVAEIVAGSYHNCVVLDTGGLECWGMNDAGGLGDGTRIDRSQPVAVKGLSGSVKAVTVGTGFTCALLEGGGVKCWGVNNLGQLGSGSYDADSTTPVDVSGLSSGVKALFSGDSSTFALLDNGKVMVWGGAAFTPVEVTGLPGTVLSIAKGDMHTCLLLAGGGVKCVGNNNYGQLGNGSNMPSSEWVDVSGLSSGVKSLAAGLVSTCALLETGTVKCWGANHFGQLGDGTTVSRNIPVMVNHLPLDVEALAGGRFYHCARRPNGTVMCWGENQYAQLGDPSKAIQKSPIALEGYAGPIASFAAGWWHNCGLLQTGAVQCRGYNGNGELGDGRLLGSNVPLFVLDNREPSMKVYLPAIRRYP
jgi:alpha-tubulin suppressor-like RCC1 family protein